MDVPKLLKNLYENYLLLIGYSTVQVEQMKLKDFHKYNEETTFMKEPLLIIFLKLDWLFEKIDADGTLGIGRSANNKEVFCFFV